MTELDVAAAPPLNEPPEWLRLNGKMVIISPLKEVVRAAVPLVAVFVAGISTHNWWQWLSLVGVVLLIARGVTHWATARYRITDEQVELRSGLFNRKTRAVPRDRIRTVDITSEWQHRLAGLSALKIGTGRQDKGKDDELILDAITKAEAERLRTLLLTKAVPAPAEQSVVDGQPPEAELVRVDRRWTWYAPFTLSGIAVVAAAFGAVWHFANDLHIRPDDFEIIRAALGVVGTESPWLLIPAAAVALLVVATIASVLGYILSYWNFSVTREQSGTLHIRHGLLNTRSVSIEEARLRGVEVKETLPLRLVRGGRATAVVSGLRTGRGDERGGGLLLPAAPVAQAHLVAAKVLREPTDPTTAALTPHPAAALRRRITRAVAAVLALALVAWIGYQLDILPFWVWIVFLVLTPFSAWLGYDRYRSLGHTLANGYLVSRSGSLVRETVALRSDGVIGWRVHASYFQRRSGLVTLVATTAAGRGGYHVTDAGASHALAFADEVVPDLVAQFLEPAT
ncbi:PH domain-containing protein [Kutzneria kofuensis]|uniref:Putative membrane protein n=1 Tax=Kutzneria kofuensis TaxID=103725 RepID=A0A7W9NF71_9PSEU|nr:PH domain-containing protein [Kutzneria kofuensis]MBB5890390.1 putative membrane protein [Kutzneria kofuensis]